jgi:hypothetical protein
MSQNANYSVCSQANNDFYTISHLPSLPEEIKGEPGGE